MSALNSAPDVLPKAGENGYIYNDFAFTVATKNGSGSQTSNGVLV